jgi:hypothetical protein
VPTLINNGFVGHRIEESATSMCLGTQCQETDMVHAIDDEDSRTASPVQ